MMFVDRCAFCAPAFPHLALHTRVFYIFVCVAFLSLLTAIPSFAPVAQRKIKIGPFLLVLPVFQSSDWCLMLDRIIL